MEFDVIIPVRNGERYISECLDSILLQSNLGKIIIIDDGSTDGTIAAIEKFKQIHQNICVLSTPPRGLSQARNLGALQATSDFITFLDSDDLWELGKLEAHDLHIAKHRDCEFSFSLASEFRLSSEKVRQRISILESPTFEDMLLQDFRISGSASSAVVRREVFVDLGGFDESLRYGEDLDMWVRMASRRMPCLIPLPLSIIRVHGESMQRVKRQGDDRFVATQTFCNIWLAYPHVCELPQFRNRASTILWGDFRRNFSIGMTIRRDFDRHLKKNYLPILVSLGLENSWNVGITLLRRRILSKLTIKFGILN
jgi:glycosyltransferase involved in cell wall biosynthesis